MSAGTEIRSYTKKELSVMYGIGRHTFRKWCIDAGLYDKYPGMIRMIILAPHIVQDIFSEFGLPENEAREYIKGNPDRY